MRWFTCKQKDGTHPPDDVEDAKRDPVDLTRTAGPTVRLLEEPDTWRHRSVETLVLDSSTDVRATTAIQMRLTEEFLTEFGVAQASRALILLPVTTCPKRPLLGFDITTSHGAPGHLILRPEIAAIQAAFCSALIASSSAPEVADVITSDLLTAISVFTPERFQFFRASTPDLADAIANYLTSASTPEGENAEPILKVSRDEVANWMVKTRETAKLLSQVLDEPEDELSSSENILLAIPSMAEPPKSLAEITKLVDDYHDAVKTAYDKQARDALYTLAEYGRRFELVVEVAVPLHQSFEISVVENRPLTVRFRGWVWQEVSANDSASLHIQVESRDTAVTLQQPVVRTMSGRSRAWGEFDGVRSTADVIAIYSAQDNRPARINVGVPLRLSRSIRWTNWLATVFTTMAFGATLALSRPIGTIDNATKIAVLTLPATVASAIILVREQSGLASRLTRNSHLALAVALTALWLSVVYRVLFRDVPLIAAHDAWTTPEAMAIHFWHGFIGTRDWLTSSLPSAGEFRILGRKALCACPAR